MKKFIHSAGAIAAYPFISPVNTAMTIGPLAAGAVANNMIGNPIGGTIDAVTGNVWNLRDDGTKSPIASTQATSSSAAPPHASTMEQSILVNPLSQAYTYGERAAAYQQMLNQKTQQQAVEQAMAMELLNGYLGMIQGGR